MPINLKGTLRVIAASNAEIVLLVYSGSDMIGVLDTNSTLFNRFNDDDERSLDILVGVLSMHISQW